MVFKKRKKKILKSLRVPFTLAGVSIGSNLLGSALGKQLPTGTPNPLTTIGTASAKAAGLAGTIALTGAVLEETRNLKPNNSKRSKLKKFKVPNIKLVKTYGKATPGIT